MKNITISIDDEIYRNARIRAAEQSTSVSTLVRNFLIEVVNGSKAGDKFDRLLQEQNEITASIRQKHPGLNSEENIPRDQIYDRHALS